MNNNFKNHGLEWHTNKLCEKGGGTSPPPSSCSTGGCGAIPPSTQPSHLTSMQCEVLNSPKGLLALDIEMMSIMYTEIILLTMMCLIIIILKWGRGEIDTLILIFLLRSLVSISFEREVTSPLELTFPKEATKIFQHLGVHMLIVINGSWLDWNSWRLRPYNYYLQHIFVFNDARKQVCFTHSHFPLQLYWKLVQIICVS